MYKIAYVVPYFGKFPKGFQFWLLSCQCNPTIDWLIFTDDDTSYTYPLNVKVTYCSFAYMRKRIEAVFDFPIALERPYKLCDYRPAYGEIFSDELEGYDLWGYCDIDLVWGDIRKFYTDSILGQYEKIGFNGHSTLYRNTPEVCTRYKLYVKENMYYKEVFSADEGYAFDEPGIDAIYDALHIPVYKGIDFANLLKYDPGFFLDWKPKGEDHKNEHQVFTWYNGRLMRHYIDHDAVKTEEYMYLHYWCRPTTFKISRYEQEQRYLIYADVTTDREIRLTPGLIKKKSRKNKVGFYMKMLWFNRKKISIDRIIFNMKGIMRYNDNNRIDTHI